MSARDASGSAPQHSHPHNNTMSRNEKFWVDQVTVPTPPPGERQGVGNNKGGGGGTPSVLSNVSHASHTCLLIGTPTFHGADGHAQRRGRRWIQSRRLEKSPLERPQHEVNPDGTASAIWPVSSASHCKTYIMTQGNFPSTEGD